jgi:hypothetical protein
VPTTEGENTESDISPSPPPVVQQVVQPAPVEQPLEYGQDFKKVYETQNNTLMAPFDMACFPL